MLTALERYTHSRDASVLVSSNTGFLAFISLTTRNMEIFVRLQKPNLSSLNAIYPSSP